MCLRRGERPKRAEQTVIFLLVFLFFISLIATYRLLAITAGLVIAHSVLTCGGKKALRLAKSGLPFALLLSLPVLIRYVLGGTLAGLDFTLMIIGKILISAVLLGTIVSKHSALYLVDGILNIGLPPLITKILALTFRYFHMVNADVQMGRKALISRGLNERKGFSTLSVTGEWIGGFFLKSMLHSEMVYKAMTSRGFQGTTGNKPLRDKRLAVESGLLVLLLATVLIADGMVQAW